MLRLKTLRFFLLSLALMITINLALSAVTFANDKHWRGRVHDKKSEDKKSEKFVNGHDARDGKWDGRGPRFRDKKSEKFVNGHDARDGKWDGRGPRFRSVHDARDSRWVGRGPRYRFNNRREARHWRYVEWRRRRRLHRRQF